MISSQGDPQDILFPRGELRDMVVARFHIAMSGGALKPIPTGYELVADAGIQFLIRIVSNLVRKDRTDKARKKKAEVTGKDFNPFLPYEKALYVTNLTQTHVCLLNKFNVLDHHILIVTREFEEQTALLTRCDFIATYIALSEMDGLVFYNGGDASGASQRHKHLQLVDLPMAPEGARIPIDPLIQQTPADAHQLSGIHFRHGFAHLPQLDDPIAMGNAVYDIYTGMIDRLVLRGIDQMQASAYNLLATRRWLMIIPRLTECYNDMSINALGFAGALLLRNKDQLKRLKSVGPMTALAAVTHPA